LNLLDPTENPDHGAGESAARRAYLVIRRGGRWSDVLRLSPDRAAVIGRSSDNEVVIRSHQASRRHAEVCWDRDAWWLRDLGSRNGTRVEGELIESAKQLAGGDRIEIAGFELSFVTRLGDALGTTGVGGGRPEYSASATDDQLTLGGPLAIGGLGSSVISRRVDESRYLDFSAADLRGSTLARRAGDGATASSEPADGWGWSELFQLAYRLAGCTSVRAAAAATLEVLARAIPGSQGEIHAFRKSAGAGRDGLGAADTECLASAATTEGGCPPPSDAMLEGMLESGRAMLVRDLTGVPGENGGQGDEAAAQAGRSFMLIPIERLGQVPGKASAVQTGWGYLHLVADDRDGKLTEERLELAAAAAGVLGAAVENLTTRGRLIRSLHRSRRVVDSLRLRLADSAQMVGNSSPMRRLRETIARLGETTSTVLITGESGVGKELVAVAIHEASSLRDGPLVCLNCAALSPTLLESELFGHEKGAFTGATEQKKGKFELADGGSLMLDEIGELDLALQAKLLRVLEGHPFERLGGQQSLRVDVRLIAATNRDLAVEVSAGRFRSDLYYRLNVIEIAVPSLRQRGDDIRLLADHYAAHFGEKTGRVVTGLTPEAYRALAAHRWPGNVRELKNVIERAVVLGQDSVIDLDDLTLPGIRLPDHPVGAGTADSGGRDTGSLDTGGSGRIERAGEGGAGGPEKSLSDVEREHVIAVLRSTAGNKSRAAEILGIERSTLDRKLKRHGIDLGGLRGAD